VSALRVLVVENDGERRLADVVANDPAAELAGVAASGRQAVALAQRVQPDAILMASSIVGGNAFDATREIMTVAPTPVVMIIDEVGAGAERTRARSREAGALAAVPFPAHAAELCDLVTAMAAVRLVRRRPERAPRPRGARGSARVVAIGASTGGPATLRAIFAAMPGDLDAPVLVTQHISSGFSDGMVNWWNAAGPLRAKIAEDGEPLANGTIYVAPEHRTIIISPFHPTLRWRSAPRRPAVATVRRPA
jgi:two-component system chemotaxis response regulator CheB